MRRMITLILAFVFVLSICACAKEEENTSVYTVEMNGTLFTVDKDNGTITDGEHTYHQTASGTSSGYSISITYPDGSSYWWNVSRSGVFSTGAGGWSDDYDENRYVDGSTLCDVIEYKLPKQKEEKNILIPFILLCAGIFNAVWPHTAWYLDFGWRIKDGEPSDEALLITRGGGIIAIIIAVIAFIV